MVSRTRILDFSTSSANKSPKLCGSICHRMEIACSRSPITA